MDTSRLTEVQLTWNNQDDPDDTFSVWVEPYRVADFLSLIEDDTEYWNATSVEDVE